MKGSTYKETSRRGTVSWRYQIDFGRDESGHRQREGKGGFKLEREAYKAMRAAIAEAEQHQGRARVSGTLAEFIQQWLPFHTTAKQLAPKTAERYESLARHATCALGHIALKDLTPFTLDHLYATLAKKLAPKTVREVHSVLHVSLERAVKTKLLIFNPANNCDLPRVDQREARALNHEQLASYQAAAIGSLVDLLIRLAAALGARRGELLALRWDDLNWDASTIRIERSLYQVKQKLGIKPTKNRTARVISIPASLMEYLRIHKEQQDHNRALVGSAYRGDLNLIFANPAGEYLLPGSVTRAARRIAEKAGLSGLQPMHGLRHTHASILLHEGVPVASVAARLGHRDAFTTAKVYQHALPNTDQDVAATWDKSTAQKAEATLRARRGA